MTERDRLIEELKKCKVCGLIKYSIAFRKYRRTCKNCESILTTDRQKLDDRKSAWNKNYRQTPKGKEALRKRTIAYRTRNPEKKRAWFKVQTALRNGTIVRGCCIECGAEKTDAHHDDYSKPLEVKWLCKLCHVKLHKLAGVE